MKMKAWQMAIVVVVVLFGSIMGTSAAGVWNTKTDKTPVRYDSGNAAGAYNPMDIKGSYDLAAVGSLFDIPVEDLAAAFGLPAGTDPAAFQLKSLESIWGAVSTEAREIGVNSVRIFTACYHGLPIELSDTTGMPAPAVDLLLDRGKPTGQQIEFLRSHRVEGTPAVP